jgi:hypothetical protein
MTPEQRQESASGAARARLGGNIKTIVLVKNRHARLSNEDGTFKGKRARIRETAGYS